MGRHKKPVELRVIQGNPGRKKITKKEPAKKLELDFSPDLPLSGYALEYWNSLSELLQKQGVLKQTDTMELSMLAYYCGKFKEISEQLQTEKIACTSDKGNVYQNPLWGALNVCQDKIQKMLIQFGMTPVARSSVFDSLEEKENPFLAI